MRKPLAVLATVAAALVIGLVPASAITNGTPDQEGHPYVGLMVAKDANGAPLWRCSGTLMSSTVFMVAGHCTESPAAQIEIWFSSGFPSGIPLGAGFPAAGPNPCAGVAGYPCTGDATGTRHTHPQYDPNAFFLHDLGVVTITSSRINLTNRGFGELPFEGQVSELGKHGSITAVGYGLQKSFPPAAAEKNEATRIRMVATPRIKAIDTKKLGDFAFETTSNASSAARASATRVARTSSATRTSWPG